MKYDIISIGSVVHDIFLQGESFVEVEGQEFATGKGICVNLGSKIDVENIYHRTGGSALNTAITFSRFGLRTALVASIGTDESSSVIQRRIDQENIATEFLNHDSKRATATSILIHSQSGERSILAYRGASLYLDISFEEIDAMLEQTAWVYITHIPEQSSDVFEYILKTAPQRNVKIALNPGSTQLKQGEKIVPLLSGVSVLFVNQEEASTLTGIEYSQEKQVFEKLDQWIDGVAVMTKGKEGVVVSDGKMQYSGAALPDPPQGFVDRTGAGDAFGSGFTAAMAQGKSIEDAIQLGSANATGVITQWGPNQGLLSNASEKDKYGILNISKTEV